MKFQKLEGLIAAPFTPMHQDGSLNVSLIPEYYQFLKRNGVIGAFINGSTGEGVSMTLEEKKSVMLAWAKATKQDDDFKVIALAYSTCVADCIALAKYAESIGLYGIAYTAPSYFKPATPQALADMCAAIAGAAPNTAFYYYHIPVLSGCFITVYDLLKAVDGRIPNFVGVKYTHEDFMDFLSCMYIDNGRYDMLWGRDENMLSALILGSFGAVGSTYNYATPLYLDMIDAFKKGHFIKARDLQQQSIDMIRLLGKYGGIATGKAYMKLVGIDCGQFRLPVKNMTEEQFELFKKDVEAVGFHGFKSK